MTSGILSKSSKMFSQPDFDNEMLYYVEQAGKEELLWDTEAM